MSATTRIFNNSDCFIEGWYWAIASRQLEVGRIKPVTLLGRDLAIYRTRTGDVVAMDAYCLHMGAHLAEGTVEDGGIRCKFHNWKFDDRGRCVDAPCVGKALPVQVQTWPAAEHYGLVWVWTGRTPPKPLPFAPELAGETCQVALGSRFIKNCHPNVVLVNAIDAHHFNTVHQFPVQIAFEQQPLTDEAVTFSNTTRGGTEFWLARMLRPFYKAEATYSMSYWYGSTGTVTLGPDALHFYIVFALRPLADGKTEGQTVLLTRRRSGVGGWLANRVILWLTEQVGAYFAKGDTQIFQTICFDLKTPTQADRSIVEFIHHIETQKPLAWGSWEALDRADNGLQIGFAAAGS